VPPIRERWLADGWEFTEGDVRDVEYRDGQLGTPAMRGSNAEVANRTGEVWRPKLHGPGTFTLKVWLGTNQRQAQATWDELLRAVIQPHRLVQWQRVTAAGETRTCWGEVTGALEPTAIGQAAYRAEIQVTVPGGYWRGDQLFSYSTPDTGAAKTRTLDLPGLALSTAALEELVVTFTGGSAAALVNPVLTDVTDRGRGEVLQYNLSIPAGKALTLDSATWALTGTNGLVPDAESVQYVGERFLTLAATPPNVAHRLTLSSTSTIPAGAGATVSGYRSYLC
jgi:hypothetical protein